MIPVIGGNPAKQALREGAYQRASIVIYDAADAEHGYPVIASFNNDNIVQGSLTVSKNGVQGDRLEYGSVISDEMQVTVRSSALVTSALLGQKITLSIEWDYDDGGTPATEFIYPFAGIVTEAVWLGDDVYRLVALDGLIVLDKPFHIAELLDPTITPSLQPLAYPVTLKNLVWSIGISVGAPYISNVGITYPADPLPNEDAVLTSIDEDAGYTYRDVLRYCAQLMRANIKVQPGPLRQLEVTPLVRDGYQIPALSVDDFYNTRCTKEPATYDEAYYHIVITRGDEVLYTGQHGDRELIISDNPLLEQAADSLGGIDELGYNLDYLLYMLPFKSIGFEGRGVSMWYFEPYDHVTVAGIDGDTSQYGLNVFITSVVHKLNGESTITAVVQLETMSLKQVIPFNQQQTAKLNALQSGLQAGIDATNGEVSGIKSTVTVLSGRDYIVEQGTSGGWTYRKWNSGVSECWMQKSESTVFSTLGSAYGIGGLFYNATAGSAWDISFPSGLFVAAPVVNGTVNSGTNTLVSWGTLSASQLLPRFWTAFTSNTTLSIVLNIYAIGRWQ